MFTVNTFIKALSNMLNYGNIPENLPVKHLEFFTPSKLTDIIDSKDYIFLNFDSEDSYDKGLTIKQLLDYLQMFLEEDSRIADWPIKYNIEIDGMGLRTSSSIEVSGEFLELF
jgi:hypothetical protein